jgi:hypothetical protein
MPALSFNVPALLGAAAIVVGAGMPLCGAAFDPSEAPFLSANQRAMDAMMRGMSVDPTGDVDVDFAAMMIPHHQGAIDMAVLELRYGRNEQLRRIAQEIIVDQQQEIVAMRLALGQSPPPSYAAPAQPDGASGTPSLPTSAKPHSTMEMQK